MLINISVYKVSKNIYIISKPYLKCVTGFGTPTVDAIVFDDMHSKDTEIFLKVWLFNCVAVLFSLNNWFDTWILYVLCIKNNDKDNVNKHVLVAMVKLTTMTTISIWFYIVQVLRALIRKYSQNKIIVQICWPLLNEKQRKNNYCLLRNYFDKNFDFVIATRRQT